MDSGPELCVYYVYSMLFGVLTYLVHGFMCNGIWEFQTGNVRVSVWSIQRVVTCFVRHCYLFSCSPLFSMSSCVFYVDNIYPEGLL